MPKLESKRCTICGASNPQEEQSCALCGSRLQTAERTSRVRATSELSPPQPSRIYDPEMGEDDLMAGQALSGPWLFAVLSLVGLLFIVALVWGISKIDLPSGNGDAVVQVLPTDNSNPNPDTNPSAPPEIAQVAESDRPTRVPPPPLPTVTPTIEPTEPVPPCIREVRANDTLYGLAAQCGHLSYDVIAEIVSLNNLPNESSLQIGQVIEIPNPTFTPDPDAPANVTNNDEAAFDVDSFLAQENQRLEPTLDPNLHYHYVAAGETMIDIIARYNIDVKILSEINPEVDFPQCDFGMQFGGPNCAVIVYENQRLRVPAPPPEPTIPPTSSGFETATPLPTPTINVPAIYSPENGALIDASSIVTLRWTSSGTLGLNEVYAIYVTDLTTDETYIGLTCESSFDMPPDWQAKTVEYREFEWYMSIANVGLSATDAAYRVRSVGLTRCNFSLGSLPIIWDHSPTGLPDLGTTSDVEIKGERYPTPPRRFFWQGRPNG